MRPSPARDDTVATPGHGSAPAEKRGLSTGALIALLVVLVIVLLVALRFAGVY